MKKTDTMCFESGITKHSKKASVSFWMWQAELFSAVVKNIAKFYPISPARIIVLVTANIAKNVITIFSSNSVGFLLEKCH